MQVLDVKPEDKILIIAPHPDDECIGAGGVLVLYPKQCSVLVLTDGRQGQGDVLPEIEKKIRKAEFLNEMHFLGIEEYWMLDIEDGTLMQHINCLEHIDFSFYTKIFVTGIYDNHPDHTAACLSLYQALQKQRIEQKEIYFYEVHNPLQSATHMLDITEIVERKIDLIQFHSSQLHSLPYDKYAKSMAQYRALQNRLQEHYIEVYTCMYSSDNPYSSTVELEKRLQKSTLFYWVLIRWMELKLKGYSVASILRTFGYNTIAVYGYAELGRLLCCELANTEIGVAYILDKKVIETEDGKLQIYKPQEGLLKVDAVVVTAIYYFSDIKEELSQLGFEHIISLRELLEIEIPI